MTATARAMTSEDAVFSGLNDEQRAAVEALRGAVCILAGAGTGKTTTITRRIAWQVASGEFVPGEILAVTFSVKAAREMGARLARLGTSGVRAMTFHAEALAQFRRFSAEQPELLGHKGQLLHQLASRLPMPHRFTALRDLASEIEWAKNRRIGPREYVERLGDHESPIPAELMSRLYADYERRKERAGVIDFEDLLERTVDLLRTDERARAAVQMRYRAFTVDEYQDVNLLQQSLLDAWIGERDDICVVGDDYQSIYGFTGASRDYLLRFGERYEGARVFTLTRNYRSTPEILEIANRLAPRLGGSDKRLRPNAEPGPRPKLSSYDTGAAEVRAIVEECKRLHGEDGVRWEEIAVLYRINGRSEDFEEAFAAAKIPYQVRDGSFLSRPAFRAFTARARRRSNESAAAAVGSILGELGHDPRGAYTGGDEATRQADLSRLAQLTAEFGEGTLAELVIDLRARHAPEEDGRGVQLMTLHRAKGLEFDVVFLPRVEERELPFGLAKSEADIAEERRLFYVGITRARRRLFISNARAREGERRAKPRPSPFLAEIRPRDEAEPAHAPSAVKKKQPRATPAAMIGAALRDSVLFERLKAWRKDVAARSGVPAYVVFHDSTLAEIARAKPSTAAALRTIPGVGALKVQRYGEQLLGLVSSDLATMT
ncbi:MAG: ATP-dependent helicase [Actinomycetota bacterium]